jgi:hypothetical protein
MTGEAGVKTPASVRELRRAPVRMGAKARRGEVES